MSEEKEEETLSHNEGILLAWSAGGGGWWLSADVTATLQDLEVHAVTQGGTLTAYITLGLIWCSISFDLTGDNQSE